MSPMNEADTRAKLIDPKLKAALWGESQIEREHYFIKGQTITNGRIYLIGEESKRREPQRVDYLLRYQGQMVTTQVPYRTFLSSKWFSIDEIIVI